MIVISGNKTRSASAASACSTMARALATLPSRSPTVGLDWAIAMRSVSATPSPWRGPTTDCASSLRRDQRITRVMP